MVSITAGDWRTASAMDLVNVFSTMAAGTLASGVTINCTAMGKLCGAVAKNMLGIYILITWMDLDATPLARAPPTRDNLEWTKSTAGAPTPGHAARPSRARGSTTNLTASAN